MAPWPRLRSRLGGLSEIPQRADKLSTDISWSVQKCCSSLGCWKNSSLGTAHLSVYIRAFIARISTKRKGLVDSASRPRAHERDGSVPHFLSASTGDSSEIHSDESAVSVFEMVLHASCSSLQAARPLPALGGLNRKSLAGLDRGSSSALVLHLTCLQHRRSGIEARQNPIALPCGPCTWHPAGDWRSRPPSSLLTPPSRRAVIRICFVKPSIQNGHGNMETASVSTEG